MKAASDIAEATIETLANSEDAIYDTCEPNSCGAKARRLRPKSTTLDTVTHNGEIRESHSGMCGENLGSWLEQYRHSSTMDAPLEAIALNNFWLHLAM